MCRRHWRLVPRQLQLRVIEHYRPGQCDDGRPSHEWVVAARDAVEAVERAERERGVR